jgi:pimeloyl-ACP methyl ester carboxylesterase
MAVALFDTSCHGESADEDFSSLPRFAEDLAAMVQALRFEPSVDPSRVALLGHSVGAAAVVLHAARQGGVRAVVALALFADPQDMMLRWLDEHRIPRRWIGRAIVEEVQSIIGERYAHIAPEATLPRVKCPVLLVHARQDTVVPMEDAQRLQAVLREGEMLVVDGDHDLRDALRPHAERLVTFLNGALGNARRGHNRDPLN